MFWETGCGVLHQCTKTAYFANKFSLGKLQAKEFARSTLQVSQVLLSKAT